LSSRADVDVKDAGVARFRKRHRARTVCGEPAFKLMAGVAQTNFRPLRQRARQWRGIFALDRLAGEDDSAAVDLALREAASR